MSASNNEEKSNNEQGFYTVIEKAPVGICITKEGGIYEFVNPAYCRIYGYEREELIGRSFLLVVPESSQKQLADLHEQFLAGGSEIRGEWNVVNREGRLITILADAVRITGDDGKARKVTFTIDITERLQMEKELASAKEDLEQQILERTDDLLNANVNLEKAQNLARLGSWEWNIAEDEIKWSRETYRIFGRDPDVFDATFEAYIDSVHPDDRKRLDGLLKNALELTLGYSVEHRVIHDDGKCLTVAGLGKVETDDAGNPVRLFGTVQDITEKAEAEAEIRRLSMVLQKSTNIIFITDPRGHIEYVNSRFEEVTGYSAEQVIGQPPSILSSGQLSRQEAADIWETIEQGHSWRGRLRNRTIDGDFFWVNAFISPIQNGFGAITNYLAIEEDITRAIAAAEEVEFLATYDKRTGLLNRESFIRRLEESVKENVCLAVIIFDIDGFRFINNSFGYAAGDGYLKQTIEIIRDTIEIDDSDEAVFGRLGADELSVFLPGKSGKEGLQFAELTRKSIESIRFGKDDINSTVSAGIAEYPEHGKAVRDLLVSLDIALYQAKQAGRNVCHLFNSADRHLSEIHTRFKQRRRIVNALENDRFVIWFQPIFNLHESDITHFEVLVRLKEEDGTILLPGAFIPAAESFGLVGAIDRVVARKTMEFQAELAGRGIHLTFSLNLSGKDLADESFLDFLQAHIQRSHAEPQNIVFEITETAAIQDLDRAVKFINTLKALGCRFSLDDFGVGFTSFVYLRELKVAFIKIDGTFVRALSEKKDDQIIVRAIAMVAKDMGIQSIAEFVETEETMKLLQEYGVDYAQGFLIGKPAESPLTILGLE